MSTLVHTSSPMTASSSLNRRWLVGQLGAGEAVQSLMLDSLSSTDGRAVEGLCAVAFLGVRLVGEDAVRRSWLGLWGHCHPLYNYHPLKETDTQVLTA